MSERLFPATAIVAGASSLVGRHLLPRLRAAGLSVIAFSRSEQPSEPGVVWRVHDIDQGWPPDLLLDGAIYVHLAPLWKLDALLGDLRSQRLGRIVAFSSTSVLSKAHSPDPAEQRLVSLLADSESRLQHSGLPFTVIRPTLIYGAGRDKNVAQIARLIRRIGFFPLIGEGRGLRQPVHADDLAAAVVAISARPATLGQVYELSGGETLSYREMVRRISLAVGKSPRILQVHPALFALALRMARVLPRFRHLNMEMVWRMNENLVFSHQLASQAFGYLPRPFTEPLS